MAYEYITTKELRKEFNKWNKIRRSIGLKNIKFQTFFIEWRKMHKNVSLPHSVSKYKRE